ncbi:MAG TPA: transporter [Terriglobales bacterium]|nr:transporter [Terriglobales bacterium]
MTRSLPEKYVRTLLWIFLFICLTMNSESLQAGPPFVTDDPEPVELHHWEVYLASLAVWDETGTSGTLPHIEVNNGLVRNLQVHVILPLAFQHTPGMSAQYGLGDTEFGLKYRFIEETKDQPMIGTFPQLEIPTGKASSGLGSGHLQIFIPVWLQKSWASWTSYGGGGFHTNPGQGNRNFWLFGWEIQKDLNSHLTLGGELFYVTPQAIDTDEQLNFNLGGQYNFNPGNHLLFSAGKSLLGKIDWMYYLAYQWTF